MISIIHLFRTEWVPHLNTKLSYCLYKVFVAKGPLICSS